ncbi:bifunctional enoyl-CoA hydratase/phosphate acetyltransferase [Hyphomicrobium sp. DY-1]|uniref:bifunctional enoyl-CoA hydratase/phosphate acetyltransferase n=1 Tax=Hyphomicrobium sp. DY-1 TaxID=3075650 RepID=UPI0039C285F9
MMSRHHHIFSKLVDRAEILEPITTAVVFPLSDVALRGACESAESGLITPTLIAPKEELANLAHRLKLDISSYKVIDVETDVKAAAVGVSLCRSGEAEALMKGSLHTDHFMHAVMDDETGLRTARRISHVFIFDVPAYPRMLLITDAAINIYPKLEDKVDIIQNAVDLAQALGISEPKVAILSAVETVTPKIISTIEAAALCKMADRGQIVGGLLEGPLAFDNAINLKAAEIKHIHSPVAGQADILVVPDLEAGNMLAKQLEYLADSEAAGIVLGARVPIVLTSRADSAKSRLASSAVAALLAHARRKRQLAMSDLTDGGGHG